MAEAPELWQFPGGLHLEDHKTESNGEPRLAGYRCRHA